VTSADGFPELSEEIIGKSTYETKLARKTEFLMSIKFGLTSTSPKASAVGRLASSGTTSRDGKALDLIHEGMTFSVTNPTICEISTQKEYIS
jgi:hypothetical protein